jgi:hypothetical protein
MPIVSESASHSQKKRPFVVREIDGRMLRKNSELSKAARMLWLTMLGMADAKTGELRHRDHWYSGKEIDARAETSERTRKPLIQELALAGLVRWERERIRRVLKDRLTGHLRMRCVSGRTKYVVLKSPHKDWFSHTPTQKSPHKHWPSSKVQSLHGARIAPASLSVNHQEAGVGVSGVSPQGQISNSPSSSVSGATPVEKPDDDLSDIPSRSELLLEKAKSILVSKGHELDYVEIALDWIDERSFELGKAPGSVAYYLKCFETLEESLTEKDLVWEHVKKRRARYAKFGISKDVTKLQLTPAQEKARQSFNQLHAGQQLEPPTKSDPIPNASPSGNSAITWDVVEDLVFYAERYRANATPKAVERARNLVHKKIVRFQNHIGEFRTPKEREDFAKYVARLKGEQKARAVAAGKPET